MQDGAAGWIGIIGRKDKQTDSKQARGNVQRRDSSTLASMDTAKKHFEQQNLETECTGAIRRWTFRISRRRKKNENCPLA